MEFKKTIVKFKISTLEYLFTLSFVLNKTLSSLGKKFSQKKYFEDEIQKIKCPSTLFWVIVKHFTTFQVIVGHSVNILDHCGSQWVTVGHCRSQWLIAANSTVQYKSFLFNTTLDSPKRLNSQFGFIKLHPVLAGDIWKPVN